MAKDKSKSNNVDPDVGAEKLKMQKSLDSYLAGLKIADKVESEVSAIAEGVKQTNPLQIGNHLSSVYNLMSLDGKLAKSDKTSKEAKNRNTQWKNFLALRVQTLGISRSTAYRYKDAWDSAVEEYPKPLVIALASKMFGERVSEDKCFGKFTKFVGKAVKAVKQDDLKDATAAEKFAGDVLMDWKPEAKKVVKKDYLLIAYQSLMNNLNLYLKAQNKDDEDYEPTNADGKDIFLTHIAPLVLFGLGEATGHTDEIEARAFPTKDYEMFLPQPPKEMKTPMGELKPAADTKPKRQRKATVVPEPPQLTSAAGSVA